MLDEIFNNVESTALKQQKLKIKSLSPIEFENLVSNLLKELGFTVKQTPPTNDGGKDIIATKQGRTYYVECKHFSEGAVGREVIQKLVGAGMIDGNVDGFIVATSSYFNANAIECADKFKNLMLWDLEDIMSLMKLYLYNTTPFTHDGLIKRFTLDQKSIITMDLLTFDNADNFFVNFCKYEYGSVIESFLLPCSKVDDVVSTLKNVPAMVSRFKAQKAVEKNMNFREYNIRPVKRQLGWHKR